MTSISSCGARPYHQSFRVSFDYPVHFTRDLFSKANPLLSEVLNRLGENRRQRIMVFIDDGVAAAHPRLIPDIAGHIDLRLRDADLAMAPLVLPGGENAKNGWDNVHTLIGHLADHRMDRHSFVMAVGGGAFLDLAGFASAIVHRGIRLIRVPTTTLAQNDAGIGVKNGINAWGQKNYLGTFSPPFAVLNDALFLPTLDFDQWIGGVSEAFKVAIIKDAELFTYLIRHADDLRNRDLAVMEAVIHRCATLHLDHIRNSGDPFEFGSARPLDFGHWAAHKLEAMSHYRIGHGQAVAIGIAMDVYLAWRMQLISEQDHAAILEGLQQCGLPIFSPILREVDAGGRLAVLKGLDQFREHLGGELTITLPKGIGDRIEVHEIDPQLVEAAIGYLSAYRGMA